MLAENFIIMKVNMSDENKNEAFLSQFQKVPAYPHFFVLDSDGTLLHSQDTGDLEEGKGYDESAFMEFLQRWSG